MKNVLIYLNKGDLKPMGGPLGYNFNLLEGLSKIEAPEISIEYLNGKSINSEVRNRVNSINDKKIKNFLSAVKSICNKTLLYLGIERNRNLDLSQYDAIHFHKTEDMYAIRKSLKKYKGKVLLTSHTPTKPSIEALTKLSKFEKKYLPFIKYTLEEMDKYAFDRADYIVFPCEEAEEPYYHNWENYSDFKLKNISKFAYLLTGTRKMKFINDKDTVREQLNIPNDAFVICYVGRHNEIKGYQRLIDVGLQLLSEKENTYILVAGNPGPIEPPKHSRWVEVGWTNDPGSYINASDIFVLPNKETYFDLILLEVLSLGQIVLASNTGGNKFFNRYEKSGIFLFGDNEELKEKVNLIMNKNSSEISSLKRENLSIYEKNFSLECFAKNYIELYKNILG